MTKRFTQFLAMCLAALLLLSSCVTPDTTPTDTTANQTSAPTDPSDTTASITEDVTEETTADVTEAPTEEGTEETTEPNTDEDTEEDTEAETEPPKTNTPGDCGNVYYTEARKTVGKVRLDSVKHQISTTNYASSVSKGTNWIVTVQEGSGYLELYGWIGFSFANFELAWRIGTESDEAYRTADATVINREAAVLQAAQKEGFTNATGYSYLLNLSAFESGEEVHLLIKDLDTDTVYCFCELTIHTNGDPTANLTGSLKEEYGLGNGSDLDVSDYDPIQEHEPITAPNDDPTVKLWFDHLTEKVTRYDISGKDSGAESYTIQMAKNEIEGCQFFLYSPTVKKITIKISDFTNDKGETLTTDLGVEYYIEDGYVTYHGYPAQLVYPDAVIPYESYISYCNWTEHGSYGMDANSKVDFGPGYILVGPFSGSNWDHAKYPFRDSIRGFVVEATTTADTTPGAYKATVEIYDAETGECIKAANLYTYVYDVTLSEETALDTSFSLWDIVSVYMHQYNENGDLTRYTDVEITKAVANYFLKNRITLTGSITYYNVMGEEWFKNPRVTSIRVLTKDQYDSMKNDPILAAKMFYYGQDEPGVARGWRPITWPDGTSETIYDNTGLLSILAVAREADQLRDVWGWEDFRMLIPFERTIDFTSFNFNSVDKTTAFPSWYEEYAVTDEKDSVEYLTKYVNVWTTVFTAITPRELTGKITGIQFMQTTKQDKASGELSDRLTALKNENGYELWSYVACEPKYTSPYQNILLFNDGTEGRTMFWTTYMQGATGFLYWHVSYYDAAGNTTYAMRCPISKTGPGDGILIYPGSAYNQLDPIPSIRLLNMRDGIEDYQLLTMLEEALGAEYANELVSHIVTSSVTFTRNDDVVYNVHAHLLRALEEASRS